MVFVLYGQRVKIGRSRKPDKRYKELSTGIPGYAKMIYVTPGGKQFGERTTQEIC
jgi:hypothetical protein